MYIVSIHFNNPLFIKLQYFSINKHVKNKNIKFIVFDDSNDENITLNNKNLCEIFNIDYIRINQNIHIDRNKIFPKKISNIRKKMMNEDKSFDIHNNISINNTAGARHVDSIQFMFNYFYENISDCNYIFNIDSDMFFINDVDLEKYFNGIYLNYISQSRATKNKKFEYIWPNLFEINIKNINNYNEISWDGCMYYDEYNEKVLSDTGGETYDFLLNIQNKKTIEQTNINSIDKLKHIKTQLSNDIILFLNNIEVDGKLFNEFYLKYDNKYCLFHIRGVSWNKQLYTISYIEKINETLKKIFLDAVILI